MNETLYDLKQLRAVTEEIIQNLAGVDVDLFPNDPINWGDLHCVEAAYIQTDDGFGHCRVLIEEASESCQEFRTYIQQELSKQGFKNIEVITEW